MANVNITLGLRSAKEKFLLYFHDLTACNRICSARLIRVFNSSCAAGSNPTFQRFRLHSGVLSRGVVASVCISFLSLFKPSGRLSGRRFVYLMDVAIRRAVL